ncbi:TetR/AcrR family transcriptional regulator [Nocardioides sp. GXZ039]|uniref:TetR/AcrR family transcriptional regulator n=1 Tax=Nocardioides sp. GXZ039 TaxID=3136018 RepID=UPI0030F382F9
MPRQAVTRREVLNQSARLFATHGYKATSLALVSERLGVTRQALYYHFKSKGAILAALFDELMTKLEAAVGEVEITAAGERFEALLRAHLTVCANNIDLLALLMHERPEIAKIEGLRANKRRREYSEGLTAAYDEGVSAGVLSDVDSWVAVNAALSAANGISLWFHGARAQRMSTATLVDLLVGMLASGYATSGRPFVAGAE